MKLPRIMAVIPPNNSQTALSVGAPVKNLDMSEPTEFVEFIPIASSAIPATSKAIPRGLFIIMPFLLV